MCDIKTSNEIGYVAPITNGITYEYIIDSFDDVLGTLDIIVKISKLETITKKVTIKLTSFKTKQLTKNENIDYINPKINKEIEKRTLSKIINDENFRTSRNLAKSDLEIKQPSDDSITLKIQSVTTNDDKTTSITIEVSSTIEGTTPKTYVVTNFLIKI